MCWLWINLSYKYLTDVSQERSVWVLVLFIFWQILINIPFPSSKIENLSYSKVFNMRYVYHFNIVCLNMLKNELLNKMTYFYFSAYNVWQVIVTRFILRRKEHITFGCKQSINLVFRFCLRTKFVCYGLFHCNFLNNEYN